ncbi:MAG: ABC transporter ATP-binding protein [Bellilinea sp.]
MPSTMENFIRIRDLRKTYVMGKSIVHALDGIDLDIAAGSFTVVMGPSGSGKSTLLHLIGGLDRPTSGSIVVEDEVLEKMDENQLAEYRRTMVGFIFQSFNLVPTMNAAENVGFPMRFARVPHHQRRARSLQLLKQVGLADRALHKPTELSGGQQQRVAIARSMINQPRVILADEPTGNLDTSSGYGIMQLLSLLHNDGHTVIVVTHDPRMQHFSTSTVYLLDGRAVTEAEYQAASTFDFEIASEGETKNES